MGFDVKVETGRPVDLIAAERRGLLEAGQEVLKAADLLAPREPVPRHGVHMTETGFVRVAPGAGEDAVAIGYGAFWAVWQHERLDYNHPHGGEAKFLEIPLVATGGTSLEIVAGNVRRALE